MRAHLVNAACGILDYIAYPAGMLLLAPLILRHRGPAEYGVWAVATAVVSTGAILASGFGDAGIQAVAAARGRAEINHIREVVRAMMSVHLLLGGCLGAVTFFLSGPGAGYLETGGNPQIRYCALIALRCAAVLLVLRAVEAVCVGTQRAFERYGAALSISAGGRLCSLLAAGWLVLHGGSVAQMLLAALFVQVLSMGLQIGALAQTIGWFSAVPALTWSQVSPILRDGRYTWLIAAAGVLFASADRLLLAFSHGAASVSGYALCVQLAQPIYGLSANGLHFLFPYLARTREDMSPADFARIVRKAAAWSSALAVALSVAVGAIGWPLMHVLAGDALKSDGRLLFTIVLSFALMSASVVAIYALIAIRRARQVAVALGVGATAMLGLMPVMLARWGTEGLAGARLFFALSCVLLYVPLFRAIQPPAPSPIREDLRDMWGEHVKGDA